jgi:hypothetical protein
MHKITNEDKIKNVYFIVAESGKEHIIDFIQSEKKISEALRLWVQNFNNSIILGFKKSILVKSINQFNKPVVLNGIKDSWCHSFYDEDKDLLLLLNIFLLSESNAKDNKIKNDNAEYRYCCLYDGGTYIGMLPNKSWKKIQKLYRQGKEKYGIGYEIFQQSSNFYNSIIIEFSQKITINKFEFYNDGRFGIFYLIPNY